MNKKFFYVSVFLIFALFLSGCGTSDIVIPDGSDEDEVQPVNQAPVIISTPDTSATVGQPYTYDVNATDSDGDTLNFSLSDKPSEMIINSSTGLISWVPASAGNYVIIVKVTDGDLFDTQDFTITVSAVTTESYTISSSSGPNGSINPSGSTTVAQEDDQTFYIIPDESYQIADVIIDGTSVGTVSSYTFTDVAANHSIHADFIGEASTNQSPIADFDVDVSSGVAPLNVYFDASSSYDTDGNITAYNWDFGDGSNDTGINVNYVYENSGNYISQLTVTDNEGAADTTSMTITVIQGTLVGGIIAEDTVWTNESSPYIIIDEDLQIPQNTKLVIKQGVNIRLGSGKKIKVAGNLLTEGSVGAPIIFTSFDSKMWRGIEFINSPDSSIKNTIIENAYRAIDLEGISIVDFIGNIFSYNNQVITDSNGYQKMFFMYNTFLGNEEVFSGIRTVGDNRFESNIFINNNNVFSHSYYFGQTYINNNNFINNNFIIKAPGIGYGYGTVEMSNNWWDTIDTSIIDNYIFDGNDDVELQIINYEPIKTSEIVGIGSPLSLD